MAAGVSPGQLGVLAACYLFRVFPIIIGLTTLFSAFLTTYQLSSTAEIVSLRTAGLSLRRILAPLYYAASFVVVANIASANILAPYFRRIESNIIAENKTINPLILLRKEAIVQNEKYHIEMDLSEGGTVAKEVLIAFHDSEKGGLSILTADKLVYDNKEISGENGSLITHLPHPKEGFHHLFIANQKKFSASNSLISPLFTSNSKRREISVKATPTSDLINISSFNAKKELLERASTCLIPLSFGIMGMSLGLLHPRQLEELRWYLLIGLVLLFFSSFFQAQHLKSSLTTLSFLLFAPHAALIGSAILFQKIYQRGRSQ